MKKLSLVWKKYINRLSVLITVFSVFMAASFYNPASLAAASDTFPWEVVFVSSTWFSWNPSLNDYNDWVSVDGIKAVAISAYTRASNSDYGFQTYKFSIPLLLWPIASRFDYDDCVVSGKFDIACSISSSSPTDITGSTPVINGVLPDGLSIGFYSTSPSYMTFGNNKTATFHLSVEFDNYEFHPKYVSNRLSFTIDFLASQVLQPSVTATGNVNATFKYTVTDSQISVMSGHAPGSGLDIVSGYNASQGNASQSKLDSSLSGQEAKEDSLFTSASDNLSKFSLTDLSSMPKVVAGLAFVSSTMTSIFEALGGVNGAGIVLSVGCSILFVSFCIGAYKFYSGRRD